MSGICLSSVSIGMKAGRFVLELRSLFLAFLLLLAFPAGAQSVPPSPNAELTAMLQKLSEYASPEQFSQISSAITASPALTEQLNDLASSRKITEIQVRPPEAIQPIQGIRFGALLDGTQLVLATDLLVELLKNRGYAAIKPGTVLPNTTTFVIGHLAFHAKTSDEMARFEEDIKRMVDEKLKSPGRHDYTDIVLLGTRTHIENEASAFIQGWNYMIDAATQDNGGKTLTVDQVSTLLVKLRYRFAFSKALALEEGRIEFIDTGMIPMNERNIKAVAKALSTSTVTDIQ